MQSVKLSLSDQAYDILVGERCLSRLGGALKHLDIGRDAVIITNPLVNKLHGRKLTSFLRKDGFTVKVLEVPDGERSKSVKQAFQLVEKIAAYDVNRQVFILALGGGVIGDLAGFVAAVYKRGIPFVQVPTTLLAQIDSAIGGKVAVDLAIGKNLVGAFYQPRLVFSDVAVLKTLSARQVKNGLAEVIKYGIICDKALFLQVERHAEKLLNVDSNLLRDVVLSCSKIKARIVMSDEKETKGIRTILNFGHTMGHAVEAAFGFHKYHHGEAVALGMRIAVDISVQMGLLAEPAAQQINAAIDKLGLPRKIAAARVPEILGHMKHDKKFQGRINRFVLATSVGGVKVVEGVPLPVIRRSLRKFLSKTL